ncbi:MAG TPA: hypothetical protein VF649_10675 [Sphingomonas sp.]|jgi:hypothetical protein|uniref:hypothetical protein n=1 Tax=Sphingomonas sp. TaxID=28214 RepID=UPI002EDA5A25
MSAAYDIIHWLDNNGEVLALARLDVRMMEATSREKLSVRAIRRDTQCSPEFLAALRREAGVVAGKPCPL